MRNADGGFYLCQAMHNVYKSSPKIRIRWLSEEPSNPNIYCMDFCDSTDLDCVLTTVTLDKSVKSKYELTKEEKSRIESILKKAIDVEKGIVARPEVTEENPDGCEFKLSEFSLVPPRCTMLINIFVIFPAYSGFIIVQR